MLVVVMAVVTIPMAMVAVMTVSTMVGPGLARANEQRNDECRYNCQLPHGCLLRRARCDSVARSSRGPGAD